MINDEILDDFKKESKSLIADMIDILEEVEGNMELAPKLADVSIFVDRIMGGARSIGLELHADHMVHQIADYSELCKAVGAKAAKITDNADFYNVCVAFLSDAIEMLKTFFEAMDEDGETDVREIMTDTFKSRLAWIKEQFEALDQTSAAPLQGQQMDQGEIDDLMSKLGF